LEALLPDNDDIYDHDGTDHDIKHYHNIKHYHDHEYDGPGDDYNEFVYHHDDHGAFHHHHGDDGSTLYHNHDGVDNHHHLADIDYVDDHGYYLLNSATTDYGPAAHNHETEEA
jgi:hypothetical protein